MSTLYDPPPFLIPGTQVLASEKIMPLGLQSGIALEEAV